jgi:UDP-glucose 4-epimerase
VQAVVHLAARAHRSDTIQKNEKDLYHAINFLGTMQLARSSISAGVEQFIFLSSIAVNGSTTDGREPFSEYDRIAPNSVYGQSKAAAEQGLSDVARNCGMSIIAIRAPMIYGAGAGGNFGKLLSAVRSGIPLPFGLVRNQRAFLGIDNLTSFILHRLSASVLPNFEVFLVADDNEVSTPDFVRGLARACARPARLFPLPISLLRPPLNALGVSDALLSSLQMNVTKAHSTGWECPLKLDEGLSLAVLS